MANEVSHRHSATGETLYFTIRNTSRQMWNTAGTPNFETLTVANWTDYDTALSESPASSYFYVGTFPAVSGNMVVGWYWVDIFKRAGGSPAISDTLYASYFGYWDGTTFKWWGNDLIHILGSLVSTSSAQLGVNVVNFGGAAGTFASGRPEVNTSHIAGSAVNTSSAQLGVNVVNAAGTAWGSGAITAASIAADAITAAKIADGAIDAATFAAGAITASAIAADAIGASELAADAVAEIQSGLATAASLSTVAGYIDTEVAAIKAVTDAIGATGTGLTAVPWNAAWDAEVQSEVQDAIEVNHLDHLLAADYDPASKPGVATALLNELVENDGGVSRYTANALEQAPSGSAGSVVLGPEYA